MSEELERTDIEAVLAARGELGPAYDAALVDGFAERVERAVQARTAAELARRHSGETSNRYAGARQTALGVVSVVLGIPITAISLAVPDEGNHSLLALLVSWTGIVGVNAAHAHQARRRG